MGCEIIIHDPGSEISNEVCELLNKSYGVKIRVTKAGKPMANGQAEAMVKNIKNKLKMLMYNESNQPFFICIRFRISTKKYRFCSDSNELPDSWDTILLPYALQAIRVDPASAHGYSPAQLMLGRPLFYPFELERKDVDVTGTFFTTNFS